MLEEQMNPLVQAEMSVLVDILYHPEVLFHSGLQVHRGFSSGEFMTKYGQLLLCCKRFIFYRTFHSRQTLV